MKRVVEYSKAVCDCRFRGCSSCDGATLIWRYLSKALEVNLFVGLAENPANAGCGIAQGYRDELARELATNLSRLGKKVVARYF